MIESDAALYCRHEFIVLEAVGIATLLGAVVAEAIKNVCTVLVVRLGRDPLKAWLDDGLAALVSVAVLWNLETSWTSIVIAVVLGLVSPWTIEKVAHLLGGGGKAGETNPGD